MAVLLYQATLKRKKRGYSSIQEEPEIDGLNMTNSKDLLGTEESKKVINRKNRRFQSMRLFNESSGEERMTIRGTEPCMSMARPFSKRTLRYINEESNKGEFAGGGAAAHTLLPNSIYYPCTIILFALVVGSA